MEFHRLQLWCLHLLFVSTLGLKFDFSQTHEVHLHPRISSLQKAGFEEFHISPLNHFSRTGGKQRFDINFLEKRPKALDLHFNAFGEDHYLSLVPTSSVLHNDAEILVSNGHVTTRWDGEFPDCFLTGDLTSHDGSASFSHCDSIQGGITTNNHEYHIEEILSEKSQTARNTTLLVTRRTHKHRESETGLKTQSNFTENLSASRHKRSVPSHQVIVELAVYSDSEFTKLFPSALTSKRIELMLLKYNGVQKEWARSDSLGYNVSFQIKRMQFFVTNPPWYNMSNIIRQSLGSICNGLKHDQPFDAIFLHTGMRTDVTGRAFQSSICNPNYRCGVDSIRSFTQYAATAHEIGHLLGMQHDDIRNCTGSDIGLMGGYGAGWSSCSIRDMNKFLESGKGSCLWKTNIPTPRELPVYPELIGQKHTPDEVCEQLHEKGFRYREYPRIGHCSMFSCVNYNSGPKYGQMFKHTYDIPGTYCGDGKICFKRSCVTWQKARQKPQEMRVGGWSNWGQWQACSRSCGTGIMFRHRVCNNPTPKNHRTCEGGAYQAVTCNTKKCPGVSDAATQAVIEQRASETCSRLLQNKVIDSNMYLPKGQIFSGLSYGVCEVKCESRIGVDIPFNRFGLMPDGTPCPGGGVLDDWDLHNWPRKPGYQARCLEGYCYKFGCNGVLNGAVIDGCGVCGGDNSTCNIVQGTFTGQMNKGERKIIARIPVGAYNVQFWFNYHHMRQNFLEIHTSEGTVVMAMHGTTHSVYATGSNPMSYAGTFWHFHYPTQYLYAKGSLNRPAIIKLYKHSHFNNTGVHFAYSLPKSVSTCQGRCTNGGTYDRSLCSCVCPSGFYGNRCNSRCNTYCLNGAPVDERTCQCQCNDRQTGSICACKANYTGENCNTCKEMKCDAKKTFNSNTCQCECPSGFTGPNCQTLQVGSGSGRKRTADRRNDNQSIVWDRIFGLTLRNLRSKFPRFFSFFRI